jgi:SPP1 family predicted phage head-tail adaptor
MLRVNIQKQDPDTEDWSLYKTFHTVSENRTGNSEYSIAGSEFSSDMITLKFRYSSAMSKLDGNTQIYRAMIGGNVYDIKSYDDIEYRHQFIKLVVRKLYA